MNKNDTHSEQSLLNTFLQSDGVGIDSRTIKDNQIFFAIKGHTVDSHQYVSDLLKDKKAYAVISSGELYKTILSNEPHLKDNLFLVKDTLEALRDLAKEYRTTLSIPLVAITGSNGKTTTKELVRDVLNTSYKTCATEGNLNNHIGVPLTILSITKEHSIAVIEMGANHIGEIKELCEIAQPTHGLITNMGKAHIGEFGGIEGVIKAKGELFDYLGEHNGKFFLNEDDVRLVKMSLKKPSIIAATYSKSDVFGFETKLEGEHNLQNIGAAYIIGHYFDIPDEKIKKAIADYTPSLGRSEWKLWLSNKVFFDAYNANPSSMRVAFDTFINIPSIKIEPKLAILGPMKELGTYSDGEHEELVNQAKAYIEQNSLKMAYFIGSEYEKAKLRNQHNEKILFFDDLAQLKAFFTEHGYPKAQTILMKSSHGQGYKPYFEQILDWES